MSVDFEVFAHRLVIGAVLFAVSETLQLVLDGPIVVNHGPAGLALRRLGPLNHLVPISTLQLLSFAERMILSLERAHRGVVRVAEDSLAEAIEAVIEVAERHGGFSLTFQANQGMAKHFLQKMHQWAIVR